MYDVLQLLYVYSVVFYVLLYLEEQSTINSDFLGHTLDVQAQTFFYWIFMDKTPLVERLFYLVFVSSVFDPKVARYT